MKVGAAKAGALRPAHVVGGDDPGAESLRLKSVAPRHQGEPDYGSQGGWRTWTAAQCHDFMLNYGDKVGTKLITCESFNYTKSLFDPILNDAAAVAYLETRLKDGRTVFGVGMNPNIVTASLKAVVSAVNRAVAHPADD